MLDLADIKGQRSQRQHGEVPLSNVQALHKSWRIFQLPAYIKACAIMSSPTVSLEVFKARLDGALSYLV